MFSSSAKPPVPTYVITAKSKDFQKTGALVCAWNVKFPCSARKFALACVCVSKAAIRRQEKTRTQFSPCAY